jgi:opacity protein-like surface antigen
MKKKMLIGVAIGLVVGVSQVYAGKLDNPAYIGAGISKVKYDTGISTTGDLDEDDRGWKIFGGYRYHENFAVEVFYADFGKTELDLAAGDTIEGITMLGGASAEDEAKSYGVSAVLLLPVSDRFDLYGKLGLHRWNTEESGTVMGVPYDGDESGTDAFFGIGAGFSPTENVTVRLEYERYRFDNDDVSATTLGVALHF